MIKLQIVIIIILVELLLVINYYFIILIHETGHLVLGMLSSYRFLYFRIGKTAAVNTDKGFRIKKAWGCISSGQCVLYPSELCKNPVYMITGGIIFNFLFMIVFCIACTLVNILYLKIIFGFISSFQLVSAIANLLSTEGKVETDGMCLRTIKTEDEIKCYHMQLLITKYLINGYSYIEIPENLFFIPDMSYNHSKIIYEMYLLLYYRYLENSDFINAKRIIRYLLKNKDNYNKDFAIKVDKETDFLAILINAKKNLGNVDISKIKLSPKSYVMSKKKLMMLDELRYRMFFYSVEEYTDLLTNMFSEYIYPGEIKFISSIYNSLER